MKINIKISKVFQIYSILKIVKKVFWQKKKQEAIVKKGIATTELWLTVAFDLMAIGLMVIGTLNPILAVKIIGVMTGVYTVSRTLVKLTATDLDDKVVAKLKTLLDKNK